MGWDYGMGTQCPAAQHHNIDGCWIVNRNSRVQASTVRDFVHRQQWCHLLMYDLALTANPNYVSLMRFRPSQCLISCRVILYITLARLLRIKLIKRHNLLSSKSSDLWFFFILVHISGNGYAIKDKMAYVCDIMISDLSLKNINF